MSREPEQSVLAVDPGREKCGLAVVDREQGVRWHQVVSTENLLTSIEELLQRFECRTLILGNQTASAPARQSLQPLLDQALIHEIIFIDERGSTEEARARYWQTYPPSGWRRIVPLGLLVPPCAVDDFAAIILGERYFKKIF